MAQNRTVFPSPKKRWNQSSLRSGKSDRPLKLQPSSPSHSDLSLPPANPSTEHSAILPPHTHTLSYPVVLLYHSEYPIIAYRAYHHPFLFSPPLSTVLYYPSQSNPFILLRTLLTSIVFTVACHTIPYHTTAHAQHTLQYSTA